MMTNNKVLITVFTPLYNRAKSIYKVYESLCQQSCYDFEWLVINDGSTDNSDIIMNEILQNHNSSFPISYFYQENKGLTRTINKALELAKGILLFRLDSDDYALSDAIQNISDCYSLIIDDNSLCSITFLSQRCNGQVNGIHPFNEITRSNFAEYRDKYRAKGDRAEVMKIDVYKNFKYPEISGEKFCPEGVVWNRLAMQYDTLYIPKAIYVKGDYDDSITANVYQYLRRNAKGVTLYYKEIVINSHFTFRYRFINAIKFYRYAFYAKVPLFKEIPICMTVAFPIALMVIAKDYFKRI